MKVISLDLEKLQEQLKTCINQRDEALQAYYRLTGAAQMIEGQIKLLQNEGEKEDQTSEE